MLPLMSIKSFFRSTYERKTGCELHLSCLFIGRRNDIFWVKSASSHAFWFSLALAINVYRIRYLKRNLKMCQLNMTILFVGFSNLTLVTFPLYLHLPLTFNSGWINYNDMNLTKTILLTLMAAMALRNHVLRLQLVILETTLTHHK